jgi:2-polyprenyl-3-methyl-5-hydroxy-6-metoxy-1,4-benzoquinol methylase
VENERIKYAACPLCSSADIHPLSTVDCSGHAMWRAPLERSMSWMTCGSCKHVFTDGYFTDEALHVIMSNTQDSQSVGEQMEYHRHISARMVERVVEASGLPNDRLWLDVGLGNGSLLMTAKEFGFEVLGVDLRVKNIEDMRKFGFAAYHGTLLDLAADAEFTSKPSVISMADVIEHEPFPVDVLRCARELIDSPGILLISMPNANAPLWDYLSTTGQNPYWYEIEHYHNFTRERLYALLRETRFEPRRYTVSERYRACMEILAEAV